MSAKVLQLAKRPEPARAKGWGESTPPERLYDVISGTLDEFSDAQLAGFLEQIYKTHGSTAQSLNHNVFFGREFVANVVWLRQHRPCFMEVIERILEDAVDDYRGGSDAAKGGA